MTQLQVEGFFQGHEAKPQLIGALWANRRRFDPSCDKYEGFATKSAVTLYKSLTSLSLNFLICKVERK